MQFAGLVTRDDYWLASDRRGVVVVVVGHLAFMCEVDPVALEDVLHLEFIKISVGEDVAAAPENTVFFVILNGALQQFVQLRDLR